MLHTATGCFRLVFLFHPLVEECLHAVLKTLVKGYVDRLQHRRRPTRDNHEVTFAFATAFFSRSVMWPWTEFNTSICSEASAALLAACTTPAETFFIGGNFVGMVFCLNAMKGGNLWLSTVQHITVKRLCSLRVVRRRAWHSPVLATVLLGKSNQTGVRSALLIWPSRNPCPQHTAETLGAALCRSPGASAKCLCNARG